jgi:hypothetical protein
MKNNISLDDFYKQMKNNISLNDFYKKVFIMVRRVYKNVVFLFTATAFKIKLCFILNGIFTLKYFHKRHMNKPHVCNYKFISSYVNSVEFFNLCKNIFN